MILRITFKDGKTEDLQVSEGHSVSSPCLMGDAGYYSVVDKFGSTVYYNWDRIRSVRLIVPMPEQPELFKQAVPEAVAA